MVIYVYILHSSILNKYYVGYAEDLTLRVRQHNEGFYINAYTKITDDWVLFYSIRCQSKKQAILIERHIKNMKSTVYIENLKKYPDIALRLLAKY